jgi:integrase/recombinase XerD
LHSPHTRRNFEVTARRFLAELPMGLRSAAVEDVCEALGKVTHGVGDATARQYVLRVKSLLGYAHKLGFAPFNAGATIKVRSDSEAYYHPGRGGAAIIIRAAPSKRDRVLLEVAYAGGFRVSEIVALTWSDVLPRDEGRVQLSITGRGGKVRQVLLPDRCVATPAPMIRCSQAVKAAASSPSERLTR